MSDGQAKAWERVWPLRQSSAAEVQAGCTGASRSHVEAGVTGRCGACGQKEDLEGDEKCQQVSRVALG